MQIRLHFVVWTNIPSGQGLEQEIFNEVERFVPKRVWNSLPNSLLYNFKTRSACEAAISETFREHEKLGRYYTETIELSLEHVLDTQLEQNREKGRHVEE